MKTYASLIRTVVDFPKPGIAFKDITPLLQDPRAVQACLTQMVADIKGPIDYVVGVEARGFIFGPLLAQKLNCGFVPVRKKGKLPYQTLQVAYDLEYGQDQLEMHIDAIASGARVVLHDDVLATGGTAKAAIKLIEQLGGEVVHCHFLIELAALQGRAALLPHKIDAVFTF